MDIHDDIRIGTIAQGGAGAEYVRQIIPYGFESFEISFWQHIGEVDVRKYARELLKVIEETEAPGPTPVVSALGLYGNPLEDEQTARDWRKLIDAAKHFGPDCKVICGFAGALNGKPVPDAMKQYKKVFTPLAKRAADNGLKIAFENCTMGGHWNSAKMNIAYSEPAWEMMFDAIPGDTIGLEWEPCHQMCRLADPLPQLRRVVDRVYHVHGKDATVLWDVVRDKGVDCGERHVYHRTPGFGDTNWHDVITILRQGGFRGAIDIEGWHDPVYRDELEMTGQVYACEYLKKCRGGVFYPNPI